MAVVEMSMDTLASRLALSFKDEFCKLLQAKLDAIAVEMAKETARDMAKGIEGMIQHYHVHQKGEVYVQLSINGIKEDVK